jgi:hypothetical protein
MASCLAHIICGVFVPVIFRQGWNPPIFFRYDYRKHFPFTDGGVSSIIDDGRPVPCLGLQKSMKGEGKKFLVI